MQHHSLLVLVFRLLRLPVPFKCRGSRLADMPVASCRIADQPGPADGPEFAMDDHKIVPGPLAGNECQRCYLYFSELTVVVSDDCRLKCVNLINQHSIGSLQVVPSVADNVTDSGTTQAHLCLFISLWH